MKVFYNLRNYQQVIEIDHGRIEKANCTCPEFVYRKTKSIGEGPEKRVIIIGRCKHLNKIVSMIDKELIPNEPNRETDPSTKRDG
mgnify:CR=1 FL=1